MFKKKKKIQSQGGELDGEIFWGKKTSSGFYKGIQWRAWREVQKPRQWEHRHTTGKGADMASMYVLCTYLYIVVVVL